MNLPNTSKNMIKQRFSQSSLNCALSFLSLISVITLITCTPVNNDKTTLTSSNYQAYLPKDDNVSFANYIKENRYRIEKSIAPIYQAKAASGKKPFLGIPIKEVVNLRSPEEIIPETACLNKSPSKKYPQGFLLVHGLFDTPNSLKDTQAALRQQYPCAVFRSILLTGHGTIPSDGTNVKYTEWVNLVEYGLAQFVGEVEDLYLIGYSTGFSLSLLRIQQKGDLVRYREKNVQIKGIIGLSPALEAKGAAFATPFLSLFVDFLGEYLDEDPAKYESLNLNLAAQFYHLSKALDLNQIIDTPMFMATSSDDTTVSAEENYKYFCQRITGYKKMIWYQGLLNQRSTCDGMIIQASKNKKYEVANISHIGIPFSPDNPIYGYKKKYAHCLSFFKENISFAECKLNSNPIIYGESNILEDNKLISGKYFRRLTFNPFFDKMIIEITKFIDAVAKKNVSKSKI